MHIGIIGISGFAETHHRAVAALQREGLARLKCTCDPFWKRAIGPNDPLAFRERGVKVYADYTSMLEAHAEDLDLVVVPTPIPLHAVMHQAAVDRGLAVYLEKPPTLDYVELEEMIARDARAKHAAVVGFNYIVEPSRQSIKQRILAGEFGKIQKVALFARWGRSCGYFERNNWAGRLFIGDRIVLDSCMGNAMSHLIHNLLFWVGEREVSSWGELSTVQAELYRVHQIEGADTVFGEARVKTGVPLRFALSHAGTEEVHEEMVYCEKARIRFIVSDRAEVLWNNGSVESYPLRQYDYIRENHLAYYRYLRGETDRPTTTLEDSRAFVWLNALAYVSSGTVTQVPREKTKGIRDGNKKFLNILGLAQRQTAFLADGVWPDDWGRSPNDPAETVGLADLHRLRKTVRAMVCASDGSLTSVQ